MGFLGGVDRRKVVKQMFNTDNEKLKVLVKKDKIKENKNLDFSRF